MRLGALLGCVLLSLWTWTPAKRAAAQQPPLFDRAIAAARKAAASLSEDRRAAALAEVAIELAKAGRLEEAKLTLKRALASHKPQAGGFIAAYPTASLALAHAACGEVTEAIRLARTLTNVERRADLLVQVAAAGPTDGATAAALYDEACDHHLYPEGRRSRKPPLRATMRAASVLRQANRRLDALTLLAEARGAVLTKPEPRERFNDLAELVLHYNGMEAPEEAAATWQAAQQIPLPEEDDSVRERRFDVAISMKDWDRALALYRQRSAANRHVTTLLSLVRAAPHLTADLLKEAERDARQKPANQRAQELTLIASAYVQKGQKAPALALLNEARPLAEKTEEPFQRAHQLGSIGVLLLQAGDRRQFDAVMPLAYAAEQAIDWNKLQGFGAATAILSRWVSALAIAEDNAAALKMAQREPASENRAMALLAIFRAQLHQGKPDAALKTAMQIRDANSRYEAFIALARSPNALAPTR
jgi:hypothetical protein